MATARWIHAHTPTLSVVDPRGLSVRNVAYCRHPLHPAIQGRITRNRFDAAGRPVASWDPRLFGTAPKSNLATFYDLQNQPLLADSVDAGWQLSLLDQSGSVRSFWDGRGSQRHTEYDALQRPLTVTEQMQDDAPRVAERFAYGGAGEESAVHNQCGQLIRHDHPAGTHILCELGLGGAVLVEQTRFLLALDPPDWPPDIAGREWWLEKEVFKTAQQYGPFGEVRGQTDAMGNVRCFAHNIAGELKEARLKLANSSELPRLLIGEIRYDAYGRVESERAGNSVITTARYSGEEGRLLQLLSCDAQGNPLQDLNYGYDPAGNITSLEDKAQLTRHFNGQRIDPVNRYRYDSLYQLIEACGREVSQPGYGPALPTWQTTPLDPNQLRNYTQTFNYDAAGNLQTRHHSNTETFEMFTSVDSNRSVADEGNLVGGFDANGNQLELLRGQRMSWDIRNQLSRVTLVRREDGPDDTECYYYDSPGHRLRKVRLTEAANRTLRAEVRYLPGLEIHCDTASDEERHVVNVEAGLSHVRVLHWVTKPPAGMSNDQLRYCLTDHLKSCTLELDEWGALLSREVYYAFGGTAVWAGTGEVADRYKTIRYSGKERDATGLYCYGFRYYATWLQRWVSPDPAGNIDGLNLYEFVKGSPVKNYDLDGRVYVGVDDEIERSFVQKGYSILARGLEEFSPVERDLINSDILEASRFMVNAQEMVSKHPEESEDVMIAYFGESYKSIESRVVEAWAAIEALISELISTGLGTDKMVKLDFPDTDTSSAKIRTDDKHGRLFLNQTYLNENEFLPIVIAHEISHLGEVSGIGAEGPETDDYWYLLNISRSNFVAGELLDSTDLETARDNSKTIVSGRSGDYLKGVENSLKNNMFVRIMEMMAGREVVSNNGDAVDIFNKYKIYRSTMASENADSLVYAAFELHIKYFALNKS